MEKDADPTITSKPETDFKLCLDPNRFNFVLKAEPQENGLHYLRKV